MFCKVVFEEKLLRNDEAIPFWFGKMEHSGSFFEFTFIISLLKRPQTPRKKYIPRFSGINQLACYRCSSISGNSGLGTTHRAYSYLEPVHKVKSLSIMFSNKACEVLNNNKFTFVNVCFQYKHNEVRGHYRQTLFFIVKRFIL